MATVGEKMTAIADAIRSKTGGTAALSLDDMASAINSLQQGKVSFGRIIGNSASTEQTVVHGLGVVPDAIFMICTDASQKASKTIQWAYTQSSAGFVFPSYTSSVASIPSGSGGTYAISYSNSTNHLPTTTTAFTGAPYGATASTFKFNGASGMYAIGTYTWIAVARNREVVNALDFATGADGKIYNGQGWKANTRVNSSWTEVSETGTYLSGYIPFTPGSTFYFKNVTLPTSHSRCQWFAYSDYGVSASGQDNTVQAQYWVQYHGGVADADGNIIQVTPKSGTLGNAKYIRFQTRGFTANSIISIDHPID